MSQRTPRNIRDIAHLYISRPKRSARRVVLAGVDRECFPGYHVANLAAALAVDGTRVHVVERSGLLMNAACFLALPPAVYAVPDGRRAAHPVRALSRVDVSFDADAAETRSRADAVSLLHLPPLDSGTEDLFDWCADATDVVVVARSRRELPAMPDVTARVWVLFVAAAEGAASAEVTPGAWRAAGHLTRWERSISDALPAAIRDPESNLARGYRECARRLVTATTPTDRRPHEGATRVRRASSLG